MKITCVLDIYSGIPLSNRLKGLVGQLGKTAAEFSRWDAILFVKGMGKGAGVVVSDPGSGTVYRVMAEKESPGFIHSHIQ